MRDLIILGFVALSLIAALKTAVGEWEPLLGYLFSWLETANNQLNLFRAITDA
jgi:hypothetical protein